MRKIKSNGKSYLYCPNYMKVTSLDNLPTTLELPSPFINK